MSGGDRIGTGSFGAKKWLLQPDSAMARWEEWSGTRVVVDKLLETKFILVVTFLCQVAGLYVLLVTPLRSAPEASYWWPVIGLGHLLLG